MMLEKKELLVKAIADNVHNITRSRHAIKTIKEIKEHLAKYGISGGRIETVLGNPGILLDVQDIRELVLLTEQFFVKTEIKELNPENWFTEIEMKESRQFHQSLYAKSDISFPLVLEDVSMAGDSVYTTTIDVKTIAQWMDSLILRYSYDIQRQPTKTTRHDIVVYSPTVNEKNVREMTDLLLKGDLVPTTIAFNAATESSNTDEELEYNARTRTLKINDGTLLNILDGYHRSLASRNAYEINPDIDFKFILIISNYTVPQAMQYQAQLAEATPISETRKEELKADRVADFATQLLRSDSELRGRISSSSAPKNSVGEIVSYSVLTDAIDREFEVNTRSDARMIAEYLGEFFEYLIGENQEEILGGVRSSDSMMGHNKMFAGYVALAAKMKNENIEPRMVNKVLEQVDFSRGNPEWKKMKLVNEDLSIGAHVKEKNIAKYFRELDMNNLITN